MTHSSLDNPLAGGLTRTRPPAAHPLNIPLVLPKVDPKAPPRIGLLEQAFKQEEKERVNQWLEEQREAKAAREAEIFKRENAQREYLRQKISGAEPPPTEPRVTSRTPSWEGKTYSASSSPRPSSATPPATPKTSGSGLGMNMQDSPNTGSPRTAVQVDVMEKHPSTLPKVSAEINAVQSLARNAATGGAVVGVTDFVYQVASGRPVVDAAGHATFSGVGSAVGTVLGASAGTAVGPVGAYVGGMIGGMVGGTMGGVLYDQLFPRNAQLPLATTYSAPPPFTGGQGDAIPYRIGGKIKYTYQNTANYYYDKPVVESDFVLNNTVWGAIESISLEVIDAPYSDNPDLLNAVLKMKSRGMCSLGNTFYPIKPSDVYTYGIHELYKFQPVELQLLEVFVLRADGQSDVVGNPLSPPLSIDNRTYTQINNQISYTTPRAEPAAGQTPAPTAYAPSSLKAKENGLARGDSLDWVPHGGLTGTLHPSTTPLLVSPLPLTSTETSPETSTKLQNTLGGEVQLNPDGSVTLIAPGKSLTQALPQIANKESLSGNYTTQTQPTISTLPQTTSRELEPDATKKIPSVPPQPETSQTTTQTVTKDDFEQFKKDFQQLITNGAILAGLTPAIQTIGEKVTKTFEQTTPDALRDASKQGSCDAFAPTGCNADIRENAKKAAQKADDNNKILEALKNLLSGFNFALIQQTWQNTLTINSKLGAAMPGGLSGALGRLSRSLGIDRVFSLINFAANLHNASMLSASLKVTLLETISSILNATGLLQTSEGENVDLNAVFNGKAEEFVVSLIGVDAWASMKLSWRKYSSIYRAATNSLNAVSSMFNSIGNALETTAEHTGKIGNAIRAAGLVRENAYNFMAEKVNVKTSKFMTFESKVGSVTQVLETVNEIAQNIVEGQQQYTEAVKATEEFKEELASAEKSSGVDNKLIKEEAEKIKANLIKDPTGEDESGLLSFLTDK